MQNIFVICTVEGTCCGVDEDCVRPVTLRTKLFEKDSEVLIHGRVRVAGIILSSEVVEMWKDPITMGLTDSVCTCTSRTLQTDETNAHAGYSLG